MQRRRWPEFGMVMAAAILVVVGSTFPALAQSWSGVHTAALFEDEEGGKSAATVLHYGLRGRWADYLSSHWVHQDKVHEAFFTNSDTMVVILKPSAKPQEAELHKALEKSYEDKVLNAPNVVDFFDEKRFGALPPEIRIFIRYAS